MAHATALASQPFAQMAAIAALAAIAAFAASPALVGPAEADVSTLTANATSYAAGEAMLLSGTGTQPREPLQLRFETPAGRVDDCIVVMYCSTTTTKNDRTFEYPEILVDDAFPADGTYKIRAHGGSQSEANAKMLLVSKAGGTVSVLGGELDIRSISRQTVNALSELSFTARVEGSGTGITFSLKSPVPDGMRITPAGVFTWTPIPSEVQTRPYRVTIVASGLGQTAEEAVEITVRARQTSSGDGVQTVTTDKTSYGRQEQITFSGTVTGSFGSQRVKLEILSPSSASVQSSTVALQFAPLSGTTFTMAPVSAASAFTVDGKYTVRTYMEQQPITDAHLSYMTKTGNSIRFDGSTLALADIPKQSTVAGSRVAFVIPVTDASFRSLDYSLTAKPSGATIDDTGVFTWTPRAADAGTTANPREHTITVRVESGSGSNAPTATKNVIIAVAPAPTPPPSATPAPSGGGGTTPAPGASPGASSDNSRVLTIATDASSYTRDDRITFSGTTQGAAAREIVSVVIEPPSGSSKIRSGLTTATNVFTLSPIDVRDAFNRAGVYTIKAFTNPQGASNAATLELQYENNRVTRYFSTPLSIASIPAKSVEVGSTLTFTATPTESSYTGLTWSLGGAVPQGATISRAGVFEWTPASLRNAQGESFQVRIMATDGTQTAGAVVMISVTPKAEAEPDPPATTPDPDPPAPRPDPAPEPPEPAPDPMEAKRTSFLSTVQGATPQSLIERYENDEGYRTWYDGQFEGLDIREALGVSLATPPAPPAREAPTGPDPRFVSSMTQGDDPQVYVERYNSDPAYKAWFDAGFPDLTIQQAVGLGAPEPEPMPDPRFVQYMTAGDDPQVYVDRYNSDPAYRAWFDSGFPDLTIQQAVGLASMAPPAGTPAPPTVPAPVPDPDPDPKFVPYMTSGDDPQVYVDRYNSDPGYKTWFDANFEGLTIQQAAGLGTAPATPTAPVPPTAPPAAPEPEPDPDPHPDFVPYMTDGDDPFTYVHRYDTDPDYAEWFDAAFPELTIEQAAGYVRPKVQPCAPGTEMVDGACTPIKSTPVPKPSVGGCLIATAAYGTELAPQVQALREIRDSSLLTTASGSSFMAAFNGVYYSFSPTVADWERQSPELRAAIRALIAPMLATLSIMSLSGGSEAGTLALGIAVIALNAGIYVAAPAGAALAVRSAARRRAGRLVRKVGFEPTNP